MNKSFIKSRSLWVAVIGFLLFLIQGFTGFVVDPAFQGSLLAGILFVLRFVTKEPIVWK